MGNQAMGELMDAVRQDDGSLIKLGTEIGKLYTNHGLPLDIALNRLDMSKTQKLVVLYGACQWFMKHRRDSGATDKALERQRKANQQTLDGFIKTGESGVY